MPIRLRRGCAVVVLLCMTAQGCLAWQPVNVDQPGRVDYLDPTGFIRVHTKAGEEIVLQRPFIRGDTVGGIANYPTTAPRTFAFSDLQSVELGRVDSRKMSFIALGFAASAAVVILFYLWAFSLDPGST